MSIRAKQFKISGNYEGDSINSKSQEILTSQELVVAFGIQAPIGTAFQINNGDEILIGATGIYELDLRHGLGTIHSIKINTDKIKENNYILVDILYDDSEQTKISLNQIEEVETI